MDSKTKGQTTAIQNANDGVSVSQLSESAMEQSTDILRRMRELAVQAGDASNGTDDRVALGKEFNTMSDELTRIAKSTNLNGENLLDGTAGVNTSAEQGQVQDADFAQKPSN
ncbi:hypothetical protein PS925_01637 [Pseudomonas fluorescens]|uniref:Flagellin N-terminal domain-containing protein n=1 Tax=Pseudomonas fluorescens TaxID=294 RepID=A0A5E7T5B3_PSEFL|nr:hypothetical protein PS925_01637 [Pseudomonas fluorescens]